MPLDSNETRLILDYCLGQSCENELAQVERLISENPEAAEAYLKIKAALSPLESIPEHICPDSLVDKTVNRLNILARASQQKLELLIAAEQAKTIPFKKYFWRNTVQTATAAAAIIFITASLIAPLSYARQMYWKQLCQMQLQKIWQGLYNYGNDHNGQMPEVASTAGQPWWKVGYQGQENHSNTRNVWLLTKGGYVNATNFICPSKSQGKVTQFDPAKAKQYNDFPARKYITYSFRIKTVNPCSNDFCQQKVLITDLNPLFEKLPNPDNSGQVFVIKINNILAKTNSSNHNGCGQNALFGDGSVNFLKTRLVGLQQDDIFTVRDKNIYQGTETPVSEADLFVAP